MAAGGWRGTLAAAAREAPGPAAGAMAAAEAAAAEVVRRLRPTEASERRRAEVVDYARRLIGAALGCEVFVYGSVPLKTYLPDGDIDLTILGNTSHDNSLVNDVYCVLDSEEQNIDAEFEVKDLNRINAEVRLIKCTIGNIIVDISFNQTGGICALCFLELVDRKVGKNHLFKRSIILIKAWCYYESRLLGAHHGLISTYALEILILYIFNLFHKSLHGPLEVLYRFLEYFSKFDWDNYCISLNGPVALSSLPNLTVEATGTHSDDLLFDKEFLKSSVDELFVPKRDSGQSGACYTRFRPKHLNIIDPLKEYNNLGRSVNRASFHRIRTALSYGARKLRQILMLQSELIPGGIYGFFKNTLGMNGRGFRRDVASTGAFHSSFGTGKDILDEISSMSISYRKGDQNNSPGDLSKGLLGDYDSYVTNFSSCLPGGHNIASSAEIRSSHFVHHGLKQYPLFYQESRSGGSEKCDMDYYVDFEMEQLSYYAAKTFNSDDRPLIQSRVHMNNQLPTLNSYANANNLTTDKKSCSVAHMKSQQPPALSLRFPDLSGDLDLQFRCLRQVQYHLEFLFDAFLQSVQESSSDDMFLKAPFHIPMHSILLDADAALPGLLLPSSAESDGMELSPVSCSHSAEAISQHSQDEDPWYVACQQNISYPSGLDIPSNGLPSSSYNDSDSSVSWCCSSEDSPEMHEIDTSFPKSYDTYREQFAPSRENGKILTNGPVLIKTNQSSAPGRKFVPHEGQVALPGRIKEVTIGQPVKVQGYIHLNRKAHEKHSCHPQKEFARHDDETRQIPKYYGDICLNMNILQSEQYSTDMELARAPNAIRQVPKYQPCNSIQSTDCTSGSLRRNLPRKQYGTRKRDEILDWQTRHLPGYEPLKQQNEQHGMLCSKKYSAGNQSYNNHKEHLSFVTGAEHISCKSTVSILNGVERGVNAKEFNENGNQLWPLLQEVPLSLHSINSQEKSPVSDASTPSFPITNGPPLETIEFGSLGPVALVSSKSKEVTNTHPGHKVLTDSSTSVVQRSRTNARKSRSSELCKVGNEDEFPPLNAVVR